MRRMHLISYDRVVEVCPTGALAVLYYVLFLLSLKLIFRHVKPDKHSLNSVCIDTDPQNPAHQIITAASTRVKENRNEITLYNTTLLPAILELRSLLSLIFCQKAELR